MITYSKISKPGSRSVNEDYIDGAKSGSEYIFVLCDGLGGHGSGDKASQNAAKTFINEFRRFNGDYNTFFKNAYKAAQNRITALQESDMAMSKMKTTLVSLVVCENSCSWSHIGDSRVYYFKDGKLVSRTEDHSVVQMLCRSGDIKESEIRFHPDRNKLLRAIGNSDTEPQCSIAEPVSTQPNTAFLLCSDGFWEYITEDKMTECLNESRSAKEWLNKMTEEVEKNNFGKRADNYSAITVMISEDGSL